MSVESSMLTSTTSRQRWPSSVSARSLPRSSHAGAHQRRRQQPPPRQPEDKATVDAACLASAYGPRSLAACCAGLRRQRRGAFCFVELSAVCARAA